MQTTFDIMIVGGGMVGSALACALAQQTSLSIAVFESQPSTPTWSVDVISPRVSAIALSSKRIFQSLKVWDLMQDMRVSPFNRIHVWDSTTTRGGEIEFSSNDIAELYLGYIIENNVMQATLHQKLLTYPHVTYFAPTRFVSYTEDASLVELTTEDGTTFKGKLAIAADGAHSWLRDQAGILLEKKDYEQQAIVATVRTSKPHGKSARQVFLETGPLAFLPLQDENMSSIVWSLSVEEAARYMMMSSNLFNEALAAAFNHVLGDVEVIDARHTFPLRKQQAKQYVQSRVVLVGDAAHTVHPLAGQGVNMGLLDAASLVEVIVDSIKAQRNFASVDNLRRYERWRRADNMGLLVGVDMIKGLFASQNESLKSLRSCGLDATNHLNIIKNMFTRHAVGDREGLPRMAMP